MGGLRRARLNLKVNGCFDPNYNNQAIAVSYREKLPHHHHYKDFALMKVAADQAENNDFVFNKRYTYRDKIIKSYKKKRLRFVIQQKRNI